MNEPRVSLIKAQKRMEIKYIGVLQKNLYCKMGFGLDSFDQPHKKSQMREQRTVDNTMQDQTELTSSRQNAEMYTYYQQMIKEMMEKYPLTGDRLALALILTRGDKPTLTKNRDLSLVDVDKMISIKNKSIKEGDMRLQNMRMAVDLSGLKNGSFARDTITPNPMREPNRGTFQIFRLVRAAQMHYFQANRWANRTNEEEDVVNTSFTHDQ